MRHDLRRTLTRGPAALLVCGLILTATMGPSCDSDAAATFRQTATGPIGEGVKTIVNGVLDGWIAAIQDAGDGGRGD
jgi:hypothetical protein